MNRTYSRSYSSSYHKNAYSPARRTATTRRSLYELIEAILCFFDRMFEALSSPALRKGIKAVASLLCVLVFIGIIGGVEHGALTLGSGILLSLMLIFVEILCVRQ